VVTGDQIAGLGAKTDRPRLNPTADLSRLRLSPTEGFVLSRIDGRVSYDEICRMSTLGREQTLAILRKLRREGLVLNPGEAAPQAASPPKASRQSPSPERGPRTPPPALVTDEMLRKAQEKAGGKGDDKRPPVPSVLERLDDGSPVDPDDLAEGPDLPEEMKRRVLRLHRRLRKLEAHELLGVEPGADQASIKRAFAAASKELHPDRYFGKDLGSYRDKLAQIFARITEALQTLKQPAGRKKG
jgi:DnaJ-domain-containing protein 1